MKILPHSLPRFSLHLALHFKEKPVSIPFPNSWSSRSSTAFDRASKVDAMMVRVSSSFIGFFYFEYQIRYRIKAINLSYKLPDFHASLLITKSHFFYSSIKEIKEYCFDSNFLKDKNSLINQQINRYFSAKRMGGQTSKSASKYKQDSPRDNNYGLRLEERLNPEILAKEIPKNEGDGQRDQRDQMNAKLIQIVHERKQIKIEKRLIVKSEGIKKLQKRSYSPAQKIKEQPRKKRISKYRNQHFECPLCFQEFNVFDRVPMMVCMNQHTYCKQCIQEYFRRIDECPECRQPYNRKYISKHRLLFTLLMDQDDDLVIRIYEREMQMQEDRLRVNRRYGKPDKMAIRFKEEKRAVSSEEEEEEEEEQEYVPLTVLREFIRCNKGLTHIPVMFDPILLVLKLDNNMIRKIDGFGHLEALRFLSLKNNQIEKIQNLQDLPELKFLYLQSNQISIVQGLIDLLSIRQVYLQNNNIVKRNSRAMIMDLREKGVDMHY